MSAASLWKSLIRNFPWLSMLARLVQRTMTLIEAPTSHLTKATCNYDWCSDAEFWSQGVHHWWFVNSLSTTMRILMILLVLLILTQKFASSNIINNEVVLSSGEIVNAKSTSHLTLCYPSLGCRFRRFNLHFTSFLL